MTAVLTGSGSECVEADCESHQECGANAHCQLSSEQNKYQCICDDGYQGDGQLCTTTGESLFAVDTVELIV